MYESIMTFCTQASRVLGESRQNRSANLSKIASSPNLSKIFIHDLDSYITFDSSSNAHASKKISGFLSPTSTKEHLLKQLVGVYKRDWKRIHRRWGKITREHKTSIEQLRNLYSKIKAPKNLILPNRLKFSEVEDQDLLRFVKEKGMKWEKAGKFMKKKPSSVRNRYYYLLRKKNSKEEIEEG
jgi:hypothetical protein